MKPPSFLPGLAALPGVLLALLSGAEPALAVDCDALGRPGSTTLLNARQTRPDGTTVPVRYCIRHGDRNEIDTLDESGRVVLHSVYDRMQAVSNTTPARGETCRYSYRVYSGDPAVYGPGDRIDFVLVAEGCGPQATFATKITVGQPSRRTLSGCILEALPTMRENIGPASQTLAIVVSPLLNWALELRPVDQPDGRPSPGMRSVVEGIGEPDEVARWCGRQAP